jgi:lipid II:glycine glycyltransferase (peptidoglycan interpeptide bridge formation enzyme)
LEHQEVADFMILIESQKITSPTPLLDSQVDSLDCSRWSDLLPQFEDASLYQTCAYGAVTKGNKNVSSLVLRADNEIVGGCVVSLRYLPFLKTGIADIKWGPLWRKSRRPVNPGVFRRLIQDLKQEYGINRGLLLRIWPDATGERKESVRRILEEEGFRHNPAVKPYRTLRLDLSPSLEDIRKNFLQKWRNCLNKAEKLSLTVVEGTDPAMYDSFLLLLNQMRERKGFIPGVDYNVFRKIQAELPEPLRMRIALCKSDGESICGSVYSAIGTTGIYLFGATGDRGLGSNGGYLLQWLMIRRLKEAGALTYDLGGIDPDENPGVYQFKLGVAGRNGVEEELLGEFHGCFTPSATAARIVLKTSQFLRNKTA